MQDAYEIYKKVAITLAGSLIVSMMLLYFCLRKLYRVKERFKELENNLIEIKQHLKVSEQLKNSIVLQLSAEQYLRRLFIKNATAIYLDNNIPNMNPTQKQINSLSSVLFPIAFTEPANDEEIDVNQVVKDLTDYLAFESTKYEIKFDKQVDTLIVQCSNAAFYQILFSLVSNLIQLMPPISNTPPVDEQKKKFTITFSEEKIVIDYETFPLNSDQVASFLSKRGFPIDAFFLDYKRILESLKAHNIEHHISTHQTCNRFELDFKKRIPKGPPKLRIVE